jgi:hypothetical protein
MSTIAVRHWQADGLRWIGGLFTLTARALHAIATSIVSAAETIERRLDRPAAITSSELYFDSDAYLAELRAEVHRKYYY